MIAIYLVVALILAFFLLQYGMVLKMRMKKGKPAPELTGSYAKALKTGNKSLFYFYSPGCGACRPMTPLIEKMMKQYKNIFKVNISQDMDTARRFGVMGTPATILVRDGRIAEFLVGPQQEKRIIELMQ
jgi:thioredoxin 1